MGQPVLAQPLLCSRHAPSTSSDSDLLQAARRWLARAAFRLLAAATASCASVVVSGEVLAGQEPLDGVTVYAVPDEGGALPSSWVLSASTNGRQ